MGRSPLTPGKPGHIPPPRRISPARWQASCRFCKINGEIIRVIRTGATKRAALDSLDEALDELKRSVAAKTTLHGGNTLNEAASLWMTRVTKDQLGTTAETYSRLLEGHVRPALGRLRLRDITVPIIEGLLDDLAARKLSASTRRMVKTVLRGIMQTAVSHGALTSSPVDHIGRIRSDKAKAPRALTVPERMDLLAKLHADEKATGHDLPDFVIFMLATGARIGEAIAVRWCDLGVAEVHAATGLRRLPIVNINGNVVRITGEGLRRHEGKTETAIRPIPLPQFAVEMLAARRPRDAPDDLPVFPSGALTYRDARNTSRALRSARKRAGYDWVSSHVFRKTAASEWKRMGLDDRQIADLMGHSQISMTQDVYFGRRELVAAGADAWDQSWTATS